MRRLALLALLPGLVLAAPASSTEVFGGRAETVEELPHLEAAHEWWYVAIQSTGSGPCGPWQAMASLVRDAEAVGDHLLFTTIIGGAAVDRSVEFHPGSMSYVATADVPTSRYRATLGDSFADVERFTGVRRFVAVSGSATLDVTLTSAALWRRRVPEGAGMLEIVLAPRATVTGTLTLGSTVCEVNGLGYFEHVWGTWSRVPMWGVDFLSAHAGPWSVVARRTPMRGETRGFPTNALAEPVLIVSDGTRIFETTATTFEVSEDGPEHPDLGIPLPTGYEVTGTAPDSSTVSLAVGAPALASILLELTSSGILEGWAPATITIGDVSHLGTAEVELQRFGTRYPH